MQTQSDETLMAGILERDARAFEALFDRYAEALHRHVCFMLHDEAAAHDVVQEAFLRMWLRAEQWDARGTLRARLYRIATNLALNSLRTERRRYEVPLELPPDPGDDEDTGGFVPAWVIDNATLGPKAAVERSEQRASWPGCRMINAKSSTWPTNSR